MSFSTPTTDFVPVQEELREWSAETDIETVSVFRGTPSFITVFKQDRYLSQP